MCEREKNQLSFTCDFIEWKQWNRRINIFSRISYSFDEDKKEEQKRFSGLARMCGPGEEIDRKIHTGERKGRHGVKHLVIWKNRKSRPTGVIDYSRYSSYSVAYSRASISRDCVSRPKHRSRSLNSSTSFHLPTSQ